MDATIYKGLGLYELKQIRDNLHGRIQDYAAGNALVTATINTQSSTKQLLSIAEIRRELGIVQTAIRTHPDALADDKTGQTPIRRIRADFSQTVIC